ncbi:MAG: tRNA-intron lyase [Nanoarchaeota archaeon]
MPKDVVTATISDQRILTEDSDQARELYAKSTFGTIQKGKVLLSSLEALYLVEKEKLIVTNTRGKEIPFEKLFDRLKRKKEDFAVQFRVFSDLRSRGYIVKTALKFGAEFRVYDKGIKPGKGHARWIVFPVPESRRFSWFEFSAKNRVAHSTRKKLLIGVVDAEDDVTYYEIKWIRP